MALKHVVLPAPLGPMRPKISPCSMTKLTLSRATRPPNRFVRPSRRRTSPMLHRLPTVLQFRRPALVGDESLRPEDHHDDKGRPEHEHPVLREAPEPLGQV